MNTSGKKDCTHRGAKYLKAQQIHYCGDCGGYFNEDPLDPPIERHLHEVMPPPKNLLNESTA